MRARGAHAEVAGLTVVACRALQRGGVAHARRAVGVDRARIRERALLADRVAVRTTAIDRRLAVVEHAVRARHLTRRPSSRPTCSRRRRRTSCHPRRCDPRCRRSCRRQSIEVSPLLRMPSVHVAAMHVLDGPHDTDAQSPLTAHCLASALRRARAAAIDVALAAVALAIGARRALHFELQLTPFGGSHVSPDCVVPSPQYGPVAVVDVHASHNVQCGLAADVTPYAHEPPAGLFSGPKSQFSVPPVKSLASTTPSPHTAFTQFGKHGPAALLFEPLSHCSPSSRTPLPHAASWQSALHVVPFGGSHCSVNATGINGGFAARTTNDVSTLPSPHRAAVQSLLQNAGELEPTFTLGSHTSVCATCLAVSAKPSPHRARPGRSTLQSLLNRRRRWPGRTARSTRPAPTADSPRRSRTSCRACRHHRPRPCSRCCRTPACSCPCRCSDRTLLCARCRRCRGCRRRTSRSGKSFRDSRRC